MPFGACRQVKVEIRVSPCKYHVDVVSAASGVLSETNLHCLSRCLRECCEIKYRYNISFALFHLYSFSTHSLSHIFLKYEMRNSNFLKIRNANVYSVRSKHFSVVLRDCVLIIKSRHPLDCYGNNSV